MIELVIYRMLVSIREISSGGKKTKGTGNTKETSGDQNGDYESTDLYSNQIGYY